MKPPKGSKSLRKGRASIKNQHYLITTTVHKRIPVFTIPETARILLSSLLWFEKQGIIILDAAVVMPDHLHFVAALKQDSLANIMRSLKRHTAREINLLLARNGSLWQSQYHDHAVRTDEDLKELVLYTLHNPVRTGLVEDFHDYPHWYCRWKA
jgi:putative transposase